MARVDTDKTINATQLCVELGRVPLKVAEGRYVASDAVDQAVLEAAVTAHVADPGYVDPDPPSPPAEVTNEKTLRDRAEAALAANATFLALASPTNADIVKQVRLVTRECSALIRLALRKFDSTDGT